MKPITFPPQMACPHFESTRKARLEKWYFSSREWGSFQERIKALLLQEEEDTSTQNDLFLFPDWDATVGDETSRSFSIARDSEDWI